MIIYTYDRDENLTGSFDFISAMPLSFVHSEHDGILTMSFLGNNEKIYEGAFVGFEDVDGNFQMFEIMQSEQTHSEKGMINEYRCEHVYYELLSEVVNIRQTISVVSFEAMIRVLAGTRWRLGRYFNSGLKDVRFPCKSVLSAINSMAETYNCTIRYRLEHNNGVISNRFVDMIERQDNITGKRFEWGKDVLSLTRSVDTRDVYTALYGQGKCSDVSGTGDNQEFERVNFKYVSWSTPDDPADKPWGEIYVADETALELYGRGAVGNKRHRFGVATFDTIDDPEELLSATWALLQTLNTPKVCYKIKALDLATLCGYEHEAFHIGDTVNILDNAFSPPLETYITVSRIDRDYLYPEKTEVTLGNQQTDMSDILQRLSQSQAKLRDKEGVFEAVNDPDASIDTARLSGAIDALNNQIVCSDDYQAAVPNQGVGILLENTNPNSAGYGALYLGPGIFSIADRKVNGLWQWKTFGRGSGFTAECINTGVLLADLIKSGLLSSHNGNSYIDMEDGSFSLGNGALVYNGQDYTRFSGSIEITEGIRKLYIDADENGGPIIGFQVNGNDIGHIFVNSYSRFVIESTAALSLYGTTGIRIENGPITLPNGRTGYTGSVTISGKTMYFNNGILYNVV